MDTSFLTKAEVARRVGLSERTVDRMPDLIKVQLSARRIGYRVADVDQWIASRAGVL